MSPNAGYVFEERLGLDARGKTALDYLSERWPHSTRETWAERIARGEVSLDGAIVDAAMLLAAGRRLAWSRPPWDEPPAPLRFDVIHEDDSLLVVSKPAGLPTMPAGGWFANTLFALVRARDPAWTPMHRLGRGTSGLVVFARGDRVPAALHAAFRERRVRKIYRALASGALPEAPFVIEASIGPRRHSRLGELFMATSDGRPSRSEVRCVRRGLDESLADVEIATGRPHQIRIHLAYAGHPLVGDPLYGIGGMPLPGCEALPGDTGYHLHAWRIGFEHPGEGWREFEAPLPERLR